MLIRHFKESASLHEVLARAEQNELAGVTLYSFECDLLEATELLEMTRDHCPPAVKDIEHAIFAATAGSFRGMVLGGTSRTAPIDMIV